MGKRLEALEKTEEIISFLVKALNNIDPHKQIGKTYIQKLLYLATREKIVNLDYSLYSYGPFSRETASEIEEAAYRNMIKIEWISEKGYFLTPGEFSTPTNLEKDVLSKLEKMVSDYSGFNAVDLSIIATAFYILDNRESSVEDVAEAVHRLKPNFSIEKIKNVLGRANIVQEISIPNLY
jgi:uncharacterized protein